MTGKESPVFHILWALFVAIALVQAGPVFAAPAESVKALVVGYKAEGGSALTDCAERLWQRGTPYRAATTDHSDSLDRWHARHGVRRVRALFRQTNQNSLADQSATLSERLVRGLSRRRGRAGGKSFAPLKRPQRASPMLQERARRMASIYRIELPDSADLETAIDELRQDPHAEFVQPDHLNQLDFDPNDPFLSSAGSWSQPYLDLWGLERIGAHEAWQITRGAGQIVAVVDTGLDYEHPDIADNVWINSGEDLNGNGRVDESDWNGLDDDDNGFVDDLHGYDFAGFGDLRPDGTKDLGDADPFDEIGHGTHVAGIVAATANNAIGIAGVAPEAQLMPLKGFPEDGSGRDSDLWRAVFYAIENGADVINASWSCSPACPVNPLAREVLALAEAANVVFVTSAGNRAFDVVRNDPENSRAAITVGSIGADDILSHFSNRGWLVDLVAPGGGPATPFSVLAAHRNILSLAASSLDPLEAAFIVGEQYWRQAGTSMAAPHVAGGVALLRSLRPDLSVADIRRLLRLSAEDLLPTRHDPIHGAGLLDLPALLETELPDLKLRLQAPGPGEVLDPTNSPIAIEFVATGRDLVSYSIAYSQGLETSEFEEISTGETFDGSESLAWFVESLSDGPYVLRLRAILGSGAIVDEFGVVGLERNHPRRLSSGTDDEQQPSIHGRTVAWRSVVDRSVNRGEIRAGGFGRRRPVLPMATLSETPKSQHNPLVSGRHIVWLERLVGTLDHEIRGCRYTPWAPNACRAELVVADTEESRLSPIGLARGRLLWSKRQTGLFEIMGCLWRSGRPCLATGVSVPAAPPSSRRLLDFDGYTILISAGAPQSRLEICRPVLVGGPCTPQPVTIDGASSLSVERASIDGDLLAFEIFPFPDSMLGYCRIDLETADCRNPRLIDTAIGVRNPDVSGRRIVWSEEVAGEQPWISFCEWDPLSGECPRTRLTGSTAPAGSPKIDRHRVVWEDARLGPDQIFGLELPRIWLPARMTTVRAGRHRIIPVAAPDPAGGRLALELIGHSGPSPEMMGARIVPLGHRWAAVEINPPSMLGGETAVWQLRGEGRGGIVTRETLEISILPGRQSGRSNTRSRTFSH
jgi:subtilisin family serine protease